MSDPIPDSAAALATSTPAVLRAAVRSTIDAAQASIDLVRSGRIAGEALLDGFDEATARLDRMMHAAALIARTHPDPAMRAAAEAADQQLDQTATDISLDRKVYDALVDVDVEQADAPTRHWLDRTRREFRRAGVDRDDATRDQIRRLQAELVRLGQEFSRNINSDTRSIRVAPGQLVGMPQDWVRSHPPAADGSVAVTTESPDVVPFLSYCRDQGARAELYRLWRRRGHPQNIPVLRRLLACRHELATLLGYPSWAAYITEDKMIGTEQAVADFIAEISAAARDRMWHDYQTLLARKQVDDPASTTVELWDVRYLTELVKAEQFAFDSAQLRPYFEYRRVQAGLMAVCSRLFGVEFRPLPDAQVWHPDVEVFDVYEEHARLGRIYLDMHPRPDKYSHAAMYVMATGKAGRRVPECALVCNLPRPGELLQHTDVRTFFHEFGHLLHHVFGGHQRWSGISGIRTERDFIEAPSQLLEEWTRDPATLAGFAVHHQTGEPLPAEQVERLRAAEELGIGLWVAQQMSYAALSLELYRRDPAELDPAQVEREEQQRHTPFPVAETWMHLSFGHLDGYSATYYTYMWSLVIAKDMFSAFDPAILLDPGVAARYRSSVLAPGGSAPAADLVRGFLGRDYTSAAYRRWLDRSPAPAPST